MIQVQNTVLSEYDFRRAAACCGSTKETVETQLAVSRSKCGMAARGFKKKHGGVL